MPDEDDKLIRRYVNSIEWIRESLIGMDELANPVLGISDWDDAVCVEFGGKKLVVSVDGPYTKRLVTKSALIHAATDVVVKGAKPMFALDTVIGEEPEVREMIESLKRQAEAMKIPLLGGNTLYEEAEPRANITVVGELLSDEPIRDSTANAGDVLALVGEPIWGEMDERIGKAGKLFDCWYKILESGIKVNAAKDVTKGGLVSVVHEMQKKSGKKFNLNDELPYPRGRNLDNFFISVNEQELDKIMHACSNSGVKFARVGKVL